MKLLNSTFIDLGVRVDWSPEDRDGFSTRRTHRRRLSSNATSKSGLNHHHLRSITPKPSHFAQAPVPAARFSDSGNTLDTRGSHSWRNRRDSSPAAAFQRSTNTLHRFSSYTSETVDDDDDDEEDPFSSGARDSFFHHSRRQSDATDRDRGRGATKGSGGGRGRTSSPCPIGLQFVSSSKRREKSRRSGGDEEWIESV